MNPRWGKRALLLSLVVMPAHAGDISLDVCNRSKIAVDVFLAVSSGGPAARGWEVSGAWIKPGACQRVYATSALGDRSDGAPTYIGFGLVDTRGQYRAGTVDQVPPLGVVPPRVKGAKERPVMTRGEKQICVRWAATQYKIDGDLERDCSQLEHGDARGDGQYVPLTTALHFWPESSACSSVTGQVRCVGGDYHLNVTARSDSPEVRVVPGTPEGDDLPLPASGTPPAILTPEEQRARDEAEYEQIARRFGTVREGAAPRKSVTEVTAQWLGQKLLVKGTVSGVESSGRWMKLSFRESPKADFLVCIDRAGFPDLGGKDHAGLVGRSIEVTGEIVRLPCAAGALGITPTSPSQVTVRGAQ
jgi:hypothetical protein